MLRKNISLTDEHIRMLEPFIKEHDGNISAAMRCAIEIACGAAPSFQERGFTRLPSPLARWLIESTGGLIPRVDVIKELMCEMGFDERGSSIEEVCERVRRMVETSGLPVQVELMERGVGSLVIKLKGSDPLLNEFVAKIVSLVFASLNPPYRIKEADDPSTLIKVHYEQGGDAHRRILEHFGYNQPFLDELIKRWEWWRWVVDTTAMLNYRVIFITQEVLEGLIQGKECPGGITYLERRSGKYYREIPFDEFFHLLREEFRNAGIVEEMTYLEDRGEILIYHNFYEPEVIERISRWIRSLIAIHWKKLEYETSSLTTYFRRIDDE
ncbi:MAG: hypothetical protein CW694_05590 [Candidatus Syntrophoarchaeum sp. WYZ-LMO15]|nr:MAG: hypothetical protein CW694_05590 [Candidatus Syntrophoarchaeum sp. WYZ-LMO15]